MIVIDPAQQSDRDNYKLLIGSVVPRPIAFITTLSASGVLNAAPFSYFSVIASDPPLLSISVQRRQGQMKDTAIHAVERKAFVVHIVDTSNVDAINRTAATVPPEQSEVALARLTPVESEVIVVPGVKEAKIRMECVLEQALPLGGTPTNPSCDLLIGRVVRFHIAHDVYDNGTIKANVLNPVARMAGNDYVTLGQQFTIERPR